MNAKKVTLIAILVSLALVLHVVERMIPIPQVVPGVKLGLANIVTVIAIFTLSFTECVTLVIVRTFLSSLFGGGLTAFLFSLSGGLLSLFIMWTLAILFAGLFSIAGISIVGAVVHNLGQLSVAALIIDTFSILYYLPFLVISATVTGALVGTTSRALLLYLSSSGHVKASIKLRKALT